MVATLVHGPEIRRFVAEAADASQPCDAALAARMPGLGRRAIRLLVELGAIRIDGARLTDPARPLSIGQVVEVLHGGLAERLVTGLGRRHERPVETAWRILHEDDDVCVVDKPSGQHTVSVDGDRPSLAAAIASRSPSGRIWVVQRLDAPTSGVLVFAKTEQANRALARTLQRHDVERIYEAVVQGAFPGSIAELDAPVRGRRALSRVAVTGRFGALATRLRFSLETGRTHQIRVHASRAGHAVSGDARYGQRTIWDAPRLALHAARLGFDHPGTGRRLVFDSPLPADLAAWQDDLAALVRELALLDRLL